jgi:hypothetical protein
VNACSPLLRRLAARSASSLAFTGRAGVIRLLDQERDRHA